MRRRHLTVVALVVTAALLVAGLAGCADPQGEPGPGGPPPGLAEAWPADTGALPVSDLVQRSAATLAVPGQAYDALNEEVRGSCLQAPPVEVQAVDQVWRRFGRPLGAREARAVLGLPSGSRAVHQVTGTDPELPEWSDPLTLRLVYRAEWRTRLDRLGAVTLAFTLDPSAPEFGRFCGDQAVVEVDHGGYLGAEVRLRFASAEARADFGRLVGDAPALWKIHRGLLAHPDRFRGKVDGGVAFRQGGGDSAGLLHRLEAQAGEGAAVACFLDFRGCGPLLDALVRVAEATGPGSLAASIAAQPIPLGARLAPWSDLGGPAASRLAPPEVRAARIRLDAAQTEQRRVESRLDVASRWPEVLPADLRSGAARARLEAAAARNRRVLASAAGRCAILSAPDDAVGAGECLAAASPEGLAAAGYDATLTAASLEP